MSFTAPEVDYAGLSPVIALTAGICVVLLAGLVGERRQRLWSRPSRWPRSPPPPACASGSGASARTWLPAPCAWTSSGWPAP